MEGKYREAESLSEIESILKNADESGCLVWQNIEGERVVYEVQEIQFIEENRETKLKLKDYKNDFHQNQQIYIKLDYRGTMFKTEINELVGSYITVSNPTNDSVKTVELRSEPRSILDLAEDKIVTLRINRKEVNQGERILRFQVSDISESGICLLVSNQNKKFMEDSKEMFITHLDEEILKEPIALERQYISDFRYKKLGKNIFTNRVGFKLDKKIQRNLLEDFLYKHN